MGVIKRGLLGGFSGKVAGVVGSSWKGIAVIKALPLSVANPKTADQVANRTSFKAAGQAGSKLLVEIVKPLWDRDAQRQSGYNAFLSANKQAFSSLGVLAVVDFIATLGKLPGTVIDSITIADGTNKAVAQWTDDSGEGEKLATDVAYVVAYNETTGKWGFSDGTVIREEGAADAVFVDNLATGDDISVWLMFQGASAAKKKYSSKSDLSNTVQ